MRKIAKITEKLTLLKAASATEYLPSERSQHLSYFPHNNTLYVQVCNLTSQKVTVTAGIEILHFYQGVVNEILQRVCAGIEIFELSIIGDDPRGWIIGAHHTTDMNRLDV